MITIITIDNIREKANELVFKDYPLQGKNSITRSQVEFVVKAIILLDREEKNEDSSS